MSKLRFLLFLVLLGFIITATVFSTDVSQVSQLLFVPIVILFTLFFNKRITLIITFIFSFIYTILSECITQSDNLVSIWGYQNVYYGFVIIIVSFCAVLCGYVFFNLSFSYTSRKISKIEVILKKRIIFRFSALLLSLLGVPIIIFFLFYGRASGVLFYLDDSLNFIYIPLLLAYTAIIVYLLGAKKIDVFFSYILLIFYLIILVSTGTRYFLLYFLPFVFLKKFYILTTRNIILIIIIMMPLLGFSQYLQKNRNEGLFKLNHDSDELFVNNSDYHKFNNSVIYKLASKGSNEGVLRNSSMIYDYTKSHGYTYGKSIGFILYWWVPRSLWKSKPVMLDYWLIRKYDRDISDAHSTASGFFGELYMDFGWFSLFFLFLLGCFISYLDFFIKSNINGDFIASSMSIVLYGWTFFMVRSLLTATYLVLIFYFIMYILKKFFLHENITNK